MAARAEADTLRGIVQIRLALEIFTLQPTHVDQHIFGGGLARQGRQRHRALTG